MAFRRREEPSVEDEREALRAQRHELEDLKRQLAERVDAVRERELQLHHALAEAERAPVASPTIVQQDAEADTGERAAAAAARERALVDREAALAAHEERLLEHERMLQGRERALEEQPRREPAEADEEHRARVEARLHELREAEKLFLRTRDELAARSDAVSARERLVAQKERELDEREDAASPWSGASLSEVEERLRRLEQQRPGEQTLGFTGGLRKLQQGAKRPQKPV